MSRLPFPTWCTPSTHHWYHLPFVLCRNTCADFKHNGCQQKLRCNISVGRLSPPLVILAPQLQDKLEATPPVLLLFGVFYRIFTCSLHRIGHFVAAFHENEKWFYYDGMSVNGTVVEMKLEDLVLLVHQNVRSHEIHQCLCTWLILNSMNPVSFIAD